MAGITCLVVAATVLPPADVLVASKPMGHLRGNAMASGIASMTSIGARSLSTSRVMGDGLGDVRSLGRKAIFTSSDGVLGWFFME